jgi:hypothetical protein
MEANTTTVAKPRRPQLGDKRYGRSKVGNGRALLPGVDGRSIWARRCRDVVAGHVADLGGLDNCSAAERSIIRRAACLTVELERLEVRFATADQADPGDLDLYTRASGNLRRLLEAIGLERRAKDISVPDPLTYARAKDAVA